MWTVFPSCFPRFATDRTTSAAPDSSSSVTAGRYDWIHVLAASERRCEDTIELNFADGSVDAEPLRISDFWAAPAWFGEVKAFESLVMHYPHHIQRGVPALMWAQRVPVTRRADLTGILLPRNVALHVFAVTFQRHGHLT